MVCSARSVIYVRVSRLEKSVGYRLPALCVVTSSQRAYEVPAIKDLPRESAAALLSRLSSREGPEGSGGRLKDTVERQRTVPTHGRTSARGVHARSAKQRKSSFMLMQDVCPLTGPM